MPKKKSKRTKSKEKRGWISGKWPQNNDNAHNVRYKKPFYTGAFFGFSLIISGLLPIAGGIYFINNRSIDGLKILGISVFIFLILFLVTFLIKSKARCPLCRGHALLSGKNKKNAKAFNIFPLTYSTTNCCTILFAHRYRCHHCGTPFILKSKKS